MYYIVFLTCMFCFFSYSLCMFQHPLKHSVSCFLDIESYNMAYGACWEPAFAQFNLATELINQRSKDPSPFLPYWDKQVLHIFNNVNRILVSCELHFLILKTVCIGLAIVAAWQTHCIHGDINMVDACISRPIQHS